ncbi:MAG: 1-deoxy-D-xylulose-5-phosphate reductoisomerase [Bacteroidales bacterium]|nr:1-deoxy-D-xylulose-5-phosphate reductoisomerase [Bacteroidales bacterium]MBR3989261.1 1-deoxy-D-xylulose-5-phosphate reductoisomerase [Bacteroidales bacterium]
MSAKTIAILGSTGSIGTQTLDVVRQNPELFSVFMISANSSAALLVEQALAFHVPHVVICNPAKYQEVRDALPASVEVHLGIEAACSLVQAPEVDVVVAAMVGFSGLRPTLSAIRAGKIIALANKETLVAAGALVMSEAARCHAPIYPVDSEHSAIFQCLQGAGDNPVRLIHLTASGGPFRTWPREEIARARKEQALKHPNWDMGAKITIDSATMMNKGFEVIEARWLFGLPASQIHVVVHPESIIHSMVEFEDGAVIAQLGCPDMRLPIALAMAYPRRLPLEGKRLDFGALHGLTFFEPDKEKFPCLKLAFDAIERGGNIPCAMNAANEAAVAAFLKDRIGFYDIPRTISRVVERIGFVENPSLDDIFATHEEAFRMAESLF